MFATALHRVTVRAKNCRGESLGDLVPAYKRISPPPNRDSLAP